MRYSIFIHILFLVSTACLGQSLFKTRIVTTEINGAEITIELITYNSNQKPEQRISNENGIQDSVLNKTETFWYTGDHTDSIRTISSNRNCLAIFKETSTTFTKELLEKRICNDQKDTFFFKTTEWYDKDSLLIKIVDGRGTTYFKFNRKGELLWEKRPPGFMHPELRTTYKQKAGKNYSILTYNRKKRSYHMYKVETYYTEDMRPIKTITNEQEVIEYNYDQNHLLISVLSYHREYHNYSEKKYQYSD